MVEGLGVGGGVGGVGWWGWLGGGLGGVGVSGWRYSLPLRSIRHVVELRVNRMCGIPSTSLKSFLESRARAVNMSKVFSRTGPEARGRPLDHPSGLGDQWHGCYVPSRIQGVGDTYR